jgi:hypothetical protein
VHLIPGDGTEPPRPFDLHASRNVLGTTRLHDRSVELYLRTRLRLTADLASSADPTVAPTRLVIWLRPGNAGG